MVNGGGRLTVAPGAITLDVGRVTRSLSGVREIVHTDREVTLVTARLVPPWFNTSLVVSDGGTAAQVVTGIWMRARLCAALGNAGFDVRETTTSFSLAREGPDSRHSRPRGPQLPLPRLALAVAVVPTAVGVVLVVSQAPAFVGLVLVSTLISLATLTRR